MAFLKLKNLVNNNLSKSTINVENDYQETPKSNEDEITYHNWGFEAAGKCNGLDIPFLGWLNLVRENFRKKSFEDELETKKVIADATSEVEKRLVQINSKENEITSLRENRIAFLKEKIENLKKEIIRVKENPHELLQDKLSKVGFYIGAFILSALTIYLFIFYSSATYSAFFKNFTIDTDLGTASSIFDPKALEHAYQTALSSLILILTIPFVFLGLGYLIYKFQEGKSIQNTIKIAALILITFVFDFILAYGITKKIYNIEKEGSFKEMPDYSMSLAIQTVDFWIIIFAGFVVYLIWGFVFDFVMEAYDKLDTVKQAIKAKETEIKLYEDDVHQNETNISAIRKEIDELQLEIKHYEKIISGKIIIVNWEGYKKCIFEFTTGWSHWMSANKKSELEVNNINQSAFDFVTKEESENTLEPLNKVG